MMSIGELARSCGVSRTTVLYYEQAGVLAPSARSAAGYRRYGEPEAVRLRQVCAYRATGLSLPAIKALLSGDDQPALIAGRLRDIERDMALLREQHDVLVRMLGGEQAAGANMDKAAWTARFRSVGLDDAAMARWHALFERQDASGHAAFLRSLGLDEEEAERIRAASRALQT